jgi:hypothetical protein
MAKYAHRDGTDVPDKFDLGWHFLKQSVSTASAALYYVGVVICFFWMFSQLILNLTLLTVSFHTQNVAIILDGVNAESIQRRKAAHLPRGDGGKATRVLVFTFVLIIAIFLNARMHARAFITHSHTHTRMLFAGDDVIQGPIDDGDDVDGDNPDDAWNDTEETQSKGGGSDVNTHNTAIVDAV